MPVIHVSLRAGKPEAYRQAIFDGLYRAMRETLQVPEDDQFMTMSEHDAANFRLTGRNSGRVVRLGDSMKVRVSRVLKSQRKIDFVPVAEPKPKQKPGLSMKPKPGPGSRQRARQKPGPPARRRKRG